jgi:hypothetical protein
VAGVHLEPIPHNKSVGPTWKHLEAMSRNRPPLPSIFDAQNLAAVSRFFVGDVAVMIM